jgi:hypothetical protein
MKLKAFDYEYTETAKEVEITLTVAENKEEKITLSKKEIAENLGYDATDKGIFSENEEMGFGGLKVSNCVTEWENVEFEHHEIKDYLENTDRLYTKEECAEMLALETAIQAEYDKCKAVFDLITTTRLLKVASKLNLSINE